MLTTTGQEKGQTLRSEVPIHETTRNLQATEYSGVAGRADKTGNYAPRNYESSKRQDLFTTESGPSVAVNRGPEQVSRTAQQRSFRNYSNNRSTTRATETFGSGLTKAIGAVVAPLMDILNPTRREETTKNLRIYGDAASHVPENYVMNPNDKPNVTIKETTLFTPHLMVTNQSQGAVGAYANTTPTDATNQRATTSTSYYGDAGTNWGDTNYGAAYNQHNNTLKEPTLYSRINHGSLELYNEPIVNVSIARNDSDRNNNRLWVPTNLPSQHVTKDMMYETRQPQTYDNPDRMENDLLTAFRQNPYTHSLSSVA
jgi:hypothetical protein